MFNWLKKRATQSGGEQDANNPTNRERVVAQATGAMNAGDLDKSVQHYRQALSRAPNDGQLRVGLSVALIRQASYAEAKTHLNRAILLDPGNAFAFYLLGKNAQGQGDFSDAIAHFKEALEIDPDFETVFGELTASYLHSGQPDSAKQALLDGLARYPQSAQFQFRLGTLYADEQNVEQALGCYDRALAVDPVFAEVHWFYAQALQQQGEIVEAMKYLRKALLIKPDLFAANSTLLWLLSFQAGNPADQYVAEARQYGAKVLSRAKPMIASMRDCSGGAKPRRLRVGMVSGDFKTHPVGYFLEGVLKALSPAKIELMAYSMNLQDDELTARIKGCFSQWTSLAGLSDEESAHKIHADGVDVLIDLAGHSAYNRLPVFAWKPAPVQVSWLGYLASTGVPGIDYVLADPVSAPEVVRDQFTEAIWHLPETFNCFTPPTEHPKLAVAALPALGNGHITFGSFQRINKLGDNTLVLWAKVLDALPTARLCLRNGGTNLPKARARLVARLEQAGIAPARVSLEGVIRNREEFLATYAQVDIILDTLRYPGTTTTCEALWMGVPTLTLAGDTLLRRVGASVLTCAGLPGWIARDEEEYVALAVRHGSDIEALARLRAGLRRQVAATALFDAGRFAPQLEEALLAMWRRKTACSTG